MKTHTRNGEPLSAVDRVRYADSARANASGTNRPDLSIEPGSVVSGRALLAPATRKRIAQRLILEPIVALGGLVVAGLLVGDGADNVPGGLTILICLLM